MESLFTFFAVYLRDFTKVQLLLNSFAFFTFSFKTKKPKVDNTSVIRNYSSRHVPK